MAAAFALRVWGIRFGLPYVYHYDEHFYINTALNLGAGVVNSPPYAPVGLSNLLFLEYAAYFVFGRVQGIFVSAPQFEAAYRADPTAFYLLARLTSVALGSLTVLPVYWLGRGMKSERRETTGLLAAGLVAISFLHVRDAHYGVPDIAMSFAIMLAIALALLGVDNGRRRFLYWGGLVAGAAVSMKWTAVPVILPVLLGSFLVRRKGEGAPDDADRMRTLLLTGLCFMLGFVLTSPQVILNPGPYVREAFGQLGAGQAGGFEIWQVDTLPGWLFYVKVLGYGLGIPLLILSAVGFIRRLADALSHRATHSFLVLLFPAAYFLLMGATRHYFARYALPLVPFMALFAAEGITGIGNWLAARQLRLARPVVMLLALVALVQPLATSIRHDTLLIRTDTRTVAKAWIEENIPEGSKIAVDWPTHGPPLATSESVVPDSRRVYDVILVGGAGLSEHPIAWYRENGYEYLIASSFIYQIPLIFPDKDQERRVFYVSLARELTEVQVFRPADNGTEPDFIFDEIYGPAISLWQRERPGPTLRIYRVRP